MVAVSTKVIAIALGLVLSGFVIATVVLAVQTSFLNSDLKDALHKLEYLENALQTTPAPATPEVPAEPEKPTEIIDYRLPTNLIPIHYNLRINPHIPSGKFYGKNVITVRVEKPTDVIKLHAHNLEINEVKLMTEGNAVRRFYLDAVREFLVIELSSKLEVGEFQFGIAFQGEMLNKIVGLYSSSYLTANGDQKWIATSKFEPTYARQAFPCFDEPAMKAKFTVTIIRPTGDGYHALSNMNVEKEVADGEYTEVHFKESVPMSSYLACFIVSDFAHKSKGVETNGIGQNFDIRVFATPQQLDKVTFALDTAVGITSYYIGYFQIAYPLPKLDMAAIPDFVSGAMEHWGLVTYRETALLYDVEISSATNKQRVATVVAHELAHMWFGNLVTMMWWNDLWLNEGFARYMEYKGVNSIYPAWKMEEQFLINALQPVMKTDASLASHPIVQIVANPDQITEIFDSITYEKGASVIRMLEDFVGADKFQEAVTNYLNKYKFNNAVTNDLLTEIEALGFDFDVKEVMRTWTEQSGLPVVEVTKVSEWQYKLTQKPFFNNPDDYGKLNYESSVFGYKWSIPITYSTNVNPSVQRIWFNQDSNEATITLVGPVKWIKFNVGQIGYYRVNYKDSWTDIINVLSPKNFETADRASLLNDVFSLADASQVPYSVALDATTYLDQESEYVPWSVAATKLTSLKRSLMFTNTFSNYLIYSRSLVEKIYRQVTWNVGADHVENRLRVTVITAACSLGLTDCLNEAASRFTAWLNDPSKKIAPDLREAVYYYGMARTGTEEVWEKMWQIFLAERDASEKVKLMYGLSGVQVPWILQRYIDLAWDEKNVRRQDYFSCIQDIAANPIGENLVWLYVRNNWENFVARFGLNERFLGRMIPSITSRFDTQTRLEEMEHFFAKYPEAGAGAAARRTALANVRSNIKWLEENQENVAAWLKEKVTSRRTFFDLFKLKQF